MPKRKFKIDDFVVTSSGDLKTITRGNYLFRGKEVVDYKDSVSGNTRISIKGMKLHKTVEVVESIDTATAVGKASTDNAEVEAVSAPSGNKYIRNVINKHGSLAIDVYDVLGAFPSGCAAVDHAIKKLLMPGRRGVKTRLQDLREAADAVNRAIENEVATQDYYFGSTTPPV